MVVSSHDLRQFDDDILRQDLQIAVVVYEKLGLEVLRRAWVNTDRLWAATFIVAAAFTLFSA